MAVSGVDFLLKIKTNGSHETLAGQRNTTLNLTTDEVDVTSKDSAKWHEGIQNIRGWSIDFDNISTESDTAQQTLITAYDDNTQLTIQVVTPGGTVYSGTCTVSDFTYEAPHDGAFTAAGTLTGDGTLTRT